MRLQVEMTTSSDNCDSSPPHARRDSAARTWSSLKPRRSRSWMGAELWLSPIAMMCIVVDRHALFLRYYSNISHNRTFRIEKLKISSQWNQVRDCSFAGGTSLGFTDDNHTINFRRHCNAYAKWADRISSLPVMYINLTNNVRWITTWESLFLFRLHPQLGFVWKIALIISSRQSLPGIS